MENHIMQSTTSKVEIRDVARGLWIWRAEHHHWKPGDDWQPIVTSTYVESGGEKVMVDPLVPKTGAVELWKRLDNRPPTMAAVLIPDHVRDIDEFVRRYQARAYGPRLFWPDDVPKTKLEIIEPDQVLPGGLVALYDGRGRLETPLWLPEQKVIVFGDTLTERAGTLRVWGSPWHEKRALPALRELLKLPFEQVIISHCDNSPVHHRAAYERALQLPPWTG
jgi:glyoxylase-like metal-dependent hydrolase (beta-lactamase superfamily II)